jgi:ribosomal protein L31E
LKRDLSKQLNVLEHQTQKAIIEMVREKVARHLASEGAAAENNDLNEAIDAQSRRAEAGFDDDDDDDADGQ